jgi:hypothetical protein
VEQLRLEDTVSLSEDISFDQGFKPLRRFPIIFSTAHSDGHRLFPTLKNLLTIMPDFFNITTIYGVIMANGNITGGPF